MDDSRQTNQSYAQPYMSAGKMLKEQAKCIYFSGDAFPGKAKEQPAWLCGR